MRWAVAGASGHTGRLVVSRLLDDGHDVVALARHATAAFQPRDGLTAVDVDVQDARALSPHLAGCRVVLSTLGSGTSRAPTTLYSVGVTNLLDAMREHDVPRIVLVSAVPAGPHGSLPWSQRHLVVPILQRVFGPTYADMRLMEAVLAASTSDWVGLRPPRLVRTPISDYRLDAGRPSPTPRALATPPWRGPSSTAPREPGRAASSTSRDRNLEDRAVGQRCSLSRLRRGPLVRVADSWPPSSPLRPRTPERVRAADDPTVAAVRAVGATLRY